MKKKKSRQDSLPDIEEEALRSLIVRKDLSPLVKHQIEIRIENIMRKKVKRNQKSKK